MTTYVQYQIDDDTTILIAAPEDLSGPTKASAFERAQVIETSTKFQQALKSAMAQARSFLQELESLHVDEGEIKFGLTTAGELGFAIGKVGLDVNYEVTLKWKVPENKRAG
jgi:Trypsin-co-occurring domain 1